MNDKWMYVITTISMVLGIWIGRKSFDQRVPVGHPREGQALQHYMLGYGWAAAMLIATQGRPLEGYIGVQDLADDPDWDDGVLDAEENYRQLRVAATSFQNCDFQSIRSYRFEGIDAAGTTVKLGESFVGTELDAKRMAWEEHADYERRTGNVLALVKPIAIV